MAEKFSLKDELFNSEKVAKIASEIKEVYAEFEQEKFEKEVVEKFPQLELKNRIFHIRDMLAKYLPADFKEATNILLKALPPELDTTKTDDDFGDFIYSPYSEFITVFGCTKEYLIFSLDALGEITKRFSVEFAIRDFINEFPKESYAKLHKWSFSKNYHQRRVASEGLRLVLPWAKKINIDYHDNLPILENLYHDNARFVTRSVANHLNDISKKDATLVLDTLKKWKNSQKQDAKEMEFIINHALRTLVKNGHEQTLIFLGYRPNPAIKIQKFKLTCDDVKIGEALEFSFDIDAQKEEGLIVDYIIHFRTKAGKFSPKVHKIKKLTLNKDERVKLSKKHHFKANMTTRKLYEGAHKIELQINGKVYEHSTFQLKEI
ncbi:MAG TPA: DNA alkylation repair protein [Campylobacterales bacterium]|nr:DNA alkylation repair protein [Campylobacterales bacterium]